MDQRIVPTTPDNPQEAVKFLSRKVEWLSRLNSNILKRSTDYSYGGGISNTLINRGSESAHFRTPYQQVVMAERMANESIFAMILLTSASIMKGFKVRLDYRTDFAKNDPLHQEILTWCQTQIDQSGGWAKIVDKLLAPAMRWGIGLCVPKFYVDDNGLVGWNDYRLINPVNIQRFIFNPLDTDEVSNVIYISLPKQVEDAATYFNYNGGDIFTGKDAERIASIKTPRAKGNYAPIDVINMPLRENFAAISSFNNPQGNPFGTPFLYWYLAQFDLYVSLMESTTASMRAVGAHPMGVKFTGSADMYDGGGDLWEQKAEINIGKLASGGGGAYIDAQGELYTVNPPDVMKALEALIRIEDVIARSSGLAQMFANAVKGGSKNMMESLDNLTFIVMSSFAEKGASDFSNTTLRYAVEQNWPRDVFFKRIKEFPQLVLDEQINPLSSGVNTGSAGEIGGSENAAMADSPSLKVRPITNTFGNSQGFVIGQNVLKDPITGGFAAGEFVKRQPQGLEAMLILDPSKLETALVNTTDSLSTSIIERLKPAMKDMVDKAVKNPLANISPFNFFNRKDFEKDIQIGMESGLRNIIAQQVDIADEAYKLANIDMEKFLRKTKAVIIEDLSQKYAKSYAFKDAVKSMSARAENYAISYVKEQATNAVIRSKSDIVPTVMDIQARINALQGETVRKQVGQSIKAQFCNSSAFVSDIVGDNEDMLFIRCGSLENMCPHCEKKYGMLYKKADDGKFYSVETGELGEFPDPECFGNRGGNSCGCFLAPVPAIMASNF